MSQMVEVSASVAHRLIPEHHLKRFL